VLVGSFRSVLDQPNCTESDASWELPYVPFSDRCPSGWVQVNGKMVPPPYTPSLTWLFDVLADPLEQNNLADAYPDVVRNNEMTFQLK
jgi:hypothetical protein